MKKKRYEAERIIRILQEPRGVRRRLAICLGVMRSPKRLSTGGDVSMAT
jgi:hypothetical protein